ncbi:MAG: GC-type dockerin domain-anchored protein [Planctomycetota bacterium]
MKTVFVLTAAAAVSFAGQVTAQNLLTNPGFDDLDTDTVFGDSWGTFGAAGFDNFFPGSGPGHAILFGDTVGNAGGFFQQGVAGTEGVEYRFRISASWELFWDADTFIAIEFYEGDDTTLIASREFNINETPDAGYGVREICAIAPAGTAFVRPVVRFDNVAFTGSLQAATFDDAELVVVDPAQERSINPSMQDTNADTTPGDGWVTFGAASATIDFFGSGNPGHGTLFGDALPNEGFLFQLGLSAIPGETYELSLDAQSEVNWEADLFYGIEFYAEDDSTKLGETILPFQPTPDTGYSRFSMQATAPAGAAFARPLIFFNKVQSAGVSRATTVDNIVVQIADDSFINFNPGLRDLYAAGNGSGWGVAGSAALDLDFFNNGNEGHATLFADLLGNTGFLFQTGIAGAPGQDYTVTADVAIEENFDASLGYGLEFFAADDATKLGESVSVASLTPGGGYSTLQLSGTAPAGTAFVRPLIFFDNVATEGAMRAATVDNVFVTEGAITPPDCIADLTTTGATLVGQPGFGVPDGTADLDDLGFYLGFFLANDASIADLTTSGATLEGQPGFGIADGVVDLDDLGFFLNAWLAGCP